MCCPDPLSLPIKSEHNQSAEFIRRVKLGLLGEFMSAIRMLALAAATAMTGIALGGCKTSGSSDASVAVPEDAAGLGPEQIKTMLTGNTLHIRDGFSRANNIKFEAKQYFPSASVVIGKAWGGWGSADDIGQWKVTETGLFCRTWTKTWQPGQMGCFKVHQQAQTYSFIKQFGAGESHTAALLPGKQM